MSKFNELGILVPDELQTVADELFDSLAYTGFTIASAAWAWWKNNSFTFAETERRLFNAKI